MSRNSIGDPNKTVGAALRLVEVAANGREAGLPVSPEDDADAELVAFMLIREIHKQGGTPLSGTPNVRGIRIERTAEQQAEHDYTIRREAHTLARAASGLKFTTGRTVGSKGPIRKGIARLLKKHSGMKNAELWSAIAAKPPKGWVFCDNSIGRYIEGPSAGQNMDYKRFCNVCAEERKISAAASVHEAHP